MGTIYIPWRRLSSGTTVEILYDRVSNSAVTVALSHPGEDSETIYLVHGRVDRIDD